MALALPPNVYALIASFLVPRDSRALSQTSKVLHAEIAPLLKQYHLPHDIAVALGHALAEQYGWTLRPEPRTLFFSGRNAYNMIHVACESREIRFDWWYGRSRHLATNRITVTVDDELKGRLLVVNRDTDAESIAQYDNGLMAALRDAGVSV